MINYHQSFQGQRNETKAKQSFSFCLTHKMFPATYFSVYVICSYVICSIIISSSYGTLFPRESETRQIKSLNGLWDFAYTSYHDQNRGFEDKWFNLSIANLASSQNMKDPKWKYEKMPVPSSYNDITQSADLRDYVGWVWYQRSFFADKNWKSDKIVIIRFDSVHYHCDIWLNGAKVTSHTGGHLPFEADITSLITYDKINMITLAVNNTLTYETIPQGQVFESKDNDPRYPKNYHKQNLNFDFFNYAGIHRDVNLYILPTTYIYDVSIFTDYEINQHSSDAMNDNETLTNEINQETISNLDDEDGSMTGKVTYSFVYDDKRSHSDFMTLSQISCYVELYEADGETLVTTNSGCSGSLIIPNVKLWWPIDMSDKPGYQYIAKLMLVKDNDQHSNQKIKTRNIIDAYYQKVGIRTINVTNNQLLINDKSIYLKGFGKHEDVEIRGRGIDQVMISKDINLIKWIGANSFRTSHYPYSEQLMDLCDDIGILVINECPAVGLTGFTKSMLSQHTLAMSELIKRDKNRPSTIMWSIANEAGTNQNLSIEYFKNIISTIKTLDNSRPITAALNVDKDKDHLAQFLDVLMINRYYSWYTDTGSLDIIKPMLIDEITNWKKLHDKPIMISEYGAGSVAGLHSNPGFVFTEDYQTELMAYHFEAFDNLRGQGFFIGEHIWNFADFMTNQESNRVYGNRKGMFTRNRQPKTAAKILRCRYLSLAKEISRSLPGHRSFILDHMKDINEHIYCPSKDLETRNVF